jgi:hypothetical protein
MSIAKRAVLFLLIFGAVGAIVFAASLFLVPGISLFPQTVFSVQGNGGEVVLNKGDYDVLFIVGGSRQLPVERGEVGPLRIQAVTNERAMPILSTPGNYYLESSDDTAMIRGHCVAKFSLPASTRVRFETELDKHGYEGLRIRSAVGSILHVMLILQALTITISLILYFAVRRFITRRRPK